MIFIVYRCAMGKFVLPKEQWGLLEKEDTESSSSHF